MSECYSIHPLGWCPGLARLCASVSFPLPPLPLRDNGMRMRERVLHWAGCVPTSPPPTSIVTSKLISHSLTHTDTGCCCSSSVALVLLQMYIHIPTYPRLIRQRTFLKKKVLITTKLVVKLGEHILCVCGWRLQIN